MLFDYLICFVVMHRHNLGVMTDLSSTIVQYAVFLLLVFARMTLSEFCQWLKLDRSVPLLTYF